MLAIARAALPFFLLLLIAVAIISLFPGLVTWLPQTMSGTLERVAGDLGVCSHGDG